MKLNLYYNNNSKSNLSSIEIKKLINEIVNKFSLTKNLELEIIFTDKSEIKKLNSKFRGMNLETDVLSFPQDRFDTKMNIIGSIVICNQVVEDKNEDLVDVIKHGFIHLIGCDHEIDPKTWEQFAKLIKCKL